MKLTRKKLKELVRKTIIELSPEGQKAKQMGLVSKGFGNWEDPKSGESFTTKGGKLHKVDKTSSAEAPSGHEPDVAPDDKEKPKQDPQAPSGYEPDIAPSGAKKAKDLANDPNADTGPDSRGTDWNASYRGSSDSAEWEDDYEEAQDDGDVEKLKQIQWFGEKQGWGSNGELKDEEPEQGSSGGEEFGDTGVKQGSLQGNQDAQQAFMGSLQGIGGVPDNYKEEHPELAQVIDNPGLDNDDKLKVFKHAMGDDWMGESLVSKLKREFKEYKVYNKNIRKI